MSGEEDTWQPEVCTVEEVRAKAPASLHLVTINGAVDEARQEYQRLMSDTINRPEKKAQIAQYIRSLQLLVTQNDMFSMTAL